MGTLNNCCISFVDNHVISKSQNWYDQDTENIVLNKVANLGKDYVFEILVLISTQQYIQSYDMEDKIIDLEVGVWVYL